MCLSSMYILLLIAEKGLSHVTIQGSRSFGSSDWVTDNGSPLPYRHSIIWFDSDPHKTVLFLFIRSLFVATSPNTTHIPAFACEIEN